MILGRRGEGGGPIPRNGTYKTNQRIIQEENGQKK